MTQTPEQKHAYGREHYQRNREAILARRRKYYEANKEAVKGRRRAYYLQNRDKVLEYHREYDAQNSAARAQYQREYKARNRETLRGKQLARRHGLLIETAWSALWEAQDGRCYLCGDVLTGLTSRQIHIEHDHRCCAPNTSCPDCRRGLACADCNAVAGHGRDDPGRLRRIADALERAQAEVAERMAAKPSQLDLGA